MKTDRCFFWGMIPVILFFLCSPCTASSSQVNIVDIALTPSEAPRVGDTVTVTVNALSADSLPVYYEFYYCANYGTGSYADTPWTVVQEYSTANTAQYTFNESGKYIIVVRAVTDPDNEPAALPIVGHVVDVGGINDVTLLRLARDPSTSATEGNAVQFTASAVTYLDDVIYYKFYYCANYGTSSYADTPWTVVQDYSTVNTCEYTFPAAGDYIVVARAVTDPDNEPAALPIVGQTVTVTSNDSPAVSCGAYIAPGVWKAFDCYNLAAIGKTTNDDPFTPSWRLIGGYWQWGRKGPDSSQWHDTNTAHFAHGPTGPTKEDANGSFISEWDSEDAPAGSWSDTSKTLNDPCPSGYRVPSKIHWDGVIENNTQSPTGTWSYGTTNYSSAVFFGDELMLPTAAGRHRNYGSLGDRGLYCHYWSSTDYTDDYVWSLNVQTGYAYTGGNYRRSGFSVRCIAE